MPAVVFTIQQLSERHNIQSDCGENVILALVIHLFFTSTPEWQDLTTREALEELVISHPLEPVRIHFQLASYARVLETDIHIYIRSIGTSLSPQNISIKFSRLSCSRDLLTSRLGSSHLSNPKSARPQSFPRRSWQM